MKLSERAKIWGNIGGSNVVVQHPTDKDRDGDLLAKYIHRDLLEAHLKDGWRVVDLAKVPSKEPVEAKTVILDKIAVPVVIEGGEAGSVAEVKKKD